jgi:hypothetical protein
MIVVTSHASITEDGRLYMGYGQAQEAIKRIPDIDYQCGSLVQAHAVNGVYGFLPVRPPRPKDRIIGFGLFQTQVHWDETADPELIKYSMDCLRQFTQTHANTRIRMNFPGLGEGGLVADEIAPLLLPLPQTVTICHKGEIQKSYPMSFSGFKTLYLKVEHMLQEGRFNQAVEFLIGNGYDIQSAMDQVRAVQRVLKEGAEKEAKRAQSYQQSHFPASRSPGR